MTPGSLLRSTRRRHGLTQKQLAIRARTSQAAISRIERDIVSPSVATLAELLRLMNEELVLEAREVDWGHDVTLNRSNLQLTVAQRLDNAGAYADFARQLRTPHSVADAFQPRRMLEVLVRHDVDFVLIGGIAGAARGSAYVTLDLDVAYARDRANLERLAAALRELEATLRGAPSDLPLVLDAKTLENGANFTFQTRYGPLDILSDPAGAPPYATLRAGAGEELLVESIEIRVASLDHLIAMKEAAGRPKDLLMASEYRVISDELRWPQDGNGAPD